MTISGAGFQVTGLTYAGGGDFLASDLSNDLYRITSAGSASFVGNMDHRGTGLAFLGGTLYSVSQDDKLRTINPATGATTSFVTITLPGFTVSRATALAAHPGTGQLFAALGRGNRRLATIDPSTGAATDIGALNPSMPGLAFVFGAAIPSDTVTLGASGVPVGATFPIPAAANPVSSPFDWTPTAAQIGDHIVTFTATDNNGAAAAPRSITIRVLPSNQAPTADANGPYTVDEGDDVQLDGTGSSDPDLDTLSFQWTTDNGSFDDDTAAMPTLSAAGLDGPSVINIGLTVCDPSNACDSDSTTVAVANVAPTITSLSLASVSPISVGPLVMPEGDTVTLTVTFTDPGTPDTHDVTVDWDDSSIEIFLNVTSPFSASHPYGDNGTYTVTVTVTDDDNDSDSAQATVTVANLDPTLALDTSGSITFPSGNTAFTGRKDVAQQHHAEATDPGSDDLTFDWDFGVSASSTTYFNNDPINTDDLPLSPDGTFPFTAIDWASVTFTAPGVYTVAVTVTDDDGGSDSDNQSLDKVVLDDCDCTKSQGFWKHQFSDKGNDEKIDNATLGSYLEIIRYGSSLFGVTVPLNDRGDAKSILDPTKSGTRPSKRSKSNNKGGKNGSQRGTGGNLDKKRDKALTQTLAAWLNYAKGSIAWDDLVDTNGDGTPDTQFAVLIAEVETILNDSNADKNDLERAKDLAEAVNLHDKDNQDCDTGTGSVSKSSSGGDTNESETSGGGLPEAQGNGKPNKNGK